MDSRKNPGFSFVNADPQLTIEPQGAFSGATGAHLLKITYNIDGYNAAVRAWGNKMASILRSETRSRFTHGKKSSFTYKTGMHAGTTEKKLSNSIRAHFRKETGGEQIDTIGFALERHGVFLQKGVGRGYVLDGTAVNRVAKSDPDGAKYRFKENWFNGPVAEKLPELEEIIHKYTGDALVLNVKRIFIQ